MGVLAFTKLLSSNRCLHLEIECLISNKWNVFYSESYCEHCEHSRRYLWCRWFECKWVKIYRYAWSLNLCGKMCDKHCGYTWTILFFFVGEPNNNKIRQKIVVVLNDVIRYWNEFEQILWHNRSNHFWKNIKRISGPIKYKMRIEFISNSHTNVLFCCTCLLLHDLVYLQVKRRCMAWITEAICSMVATETVKRRHIHVYMIDWIIVCYGLCRDLM